MQWLVYAYLATLTLVGRTRTMVTYYGTLTTAGTPTSLRLPWLHLTTMHRQVHLYLLWLSNPNPSPCPNPNPNVLRYAYLAKFIVLSEEESDLRLLDLAMDGLGTTEAALIEFLCARPPD